MPSLFTLCNWALIFSGQFFSSIWNGISSPSSGAIAGQNNSTATVFEKCVNYGILTKPSSEPMIGKLSSTPTITDCVNYYVA